MHIMQKCKNRAKFNIIAAGAKPSGPAACLPIVSISPRRKFSFLRRETASLRQVGNLDDPQRERKPPFEWVIACFALRDEYGSKTMVRGTPFKMVRLTPFFCDIFKKRPE